MYMIRTIRELIQYSADQIKELPLHPSAMIGDGRIREVDTKLGAVGLSLAKPRADRAYEKYPHVGLIFGLPVQSIGLSQKAKRQANKLGIDTIGQAARAPLLDIMNGMSLDAAQELIEGLQGLAVVLDKKQSN